MKMPLIEQTTREFSISHPTPVALAWCESLCSVSHPTPQARVTLYNKATFLRDSLEEGVVQKLARILQCFMYTQDRLQSRTLLTIVERGSKNSRNSIFDFHKHKTQMTIENSVSNDFINVFDCRLSGDFLDIKSSNLIKVGH